MVGGIKRIASLYSKATATRKGSDAAEGSGKRPQGRPRGRGKTRPLSPIPSSPSEVPSAHSSSSSSEEEEVQVEEAGVEEEKEPGVEEEEAGVEEETGGTSSSTSSCVRLRGPLTLPRRPILL